MSGALELPDVVERYLGSSSSETRSSFSEALAWLKAEAKAGHWDELARAVPRFVVPGLDYTSASSLWRIASRVADNAKLYDRTTKLAVLGGFTTHQLVDLIRLYLTAGRVGAEVYEADYGIFRQELLDPSSGVYESKPDTIFLATTWRDLGHVPALSDDRDEVRRKVDLEVADWLLLWKTAHERLGCQIIQNNFDTPPWRTLGNHEARHPSGFARYASLVNHALQDAAPPYVTIHDLDGLSSSWGRTQWGDERFYHHAKLPCPPELLVDYGHSVASLLLAGLGLGKKCLVLDLDNTCWGGVIGDDGLGGIRIGQGEPEGESFLSFQKYAKALKERGVILAVCSKNTDSVAREVFEKHTEMALRLDDISCFVANWDDKASNLRKIAERLNIGLNSLVFADDNPAERAIVRRLVPEVAIPELPEDPAGYIQAIEKHRYFQTLALSGEDLQRADFYRADEQRATLESSADDLKGFLDSLGMVARVVPVDASSLERTAQLIVRSNQYNLTTRRHSAADVMAMMADPQWVTRTVSLRDRFGDNGLISVFFARPEGDALAIDTWLMSCRVLKRGVEQYLLNHAAEVARSLGLARLWGEYLPTPKNALVRDHYAKLGFTQVSEDDAGRTTWELNLGGDWQPFETSITEA